MSMRVYSLALLEGAGYIFLETLLPLFTHNCFVRISRLLPYTHCPSSEL